MGFRLITKAGEKGIINLSKCAPVVGGLVGASLDYFETEKLHQEHMNVFLKAGRKCITTFGRVRKIQWKQSVRILMAWSNQR